MLIGAHVSPAGGLANAIGRGVERGCDAIQIFNQSPRMWRPTAYGEEDFASFREAMEPSRVDAVLIHAVYLLNCASEDPEIREKSLASLDPVAADRRRHRRGRGGAPSRLGQGGDVGEAIARAGGVIREALEQTDSCPLHLEDTAGAGGTLGRSFDELSALIEAAGGGARLGLCLDSCHLLASGYDIRTADGLAETLGECDRAVGLDRLHSLHVNDSMTPLGSNRDRHARLGEGEIGRDGCAAFLSEPRFEGLPCVLETGSNGAIEKGDVTAARRLRTRGLKARG